MGKNLNLLLSKYLNFRFYECKFKFVFKVNIFFIESGLELINNRKAISD